MDALVILKSYIDDLQHHDWYYNFSDDQQAWKIGADTYYRLIETEKSIDKEFQIWNTIAPDQFKDGKNE